MTITRKIMAEILPQGEDEAIIYSYDFTNVVSALGAVLAINSCVLFDETDNIDVSATKFTGVASLVGSIISSPIVSNLVEKHTYRLTMGADFAGAQIVSAYMFIKGER